MERLTERFADGTAYTTKYFRTHNGVITTHKGEVVDKLAEYEDAEEQGLLLRLKVAVGKHIYYSLHDIGIVVKFTIVKIEIYEDEILFEDEEGNMWDEKDFGKTVFLTREEAEFALAEKGGVVCVK